MVSAARVASETELIKLTSRRSAWGGKRTASPLCACIPAMPCIAGDPGTGTHARNCSHATRAAHAGSWPGATVTSQVSVAPSWNALPIDPSRAEAAATHFYNCVE